MGIAPDTVWRGKSPCRMTSYRDNCPGEIWWWVELARDGDRWMPSKGTGEVKIYRIWCWIGSWVRGKIGRFQRQFLSFWFWFYHSLAKGILASEFPHHFWLGRIFIIVTIYMKHNQVVVFMKLIPQYFSFDRCLNYALWDPCFVFPDSFGLQIIKWIKLSPVVL